MKSHPTLTSYLVPERDRTNSTLYLCLVLSAGLSVGLMFREMGRLSEGADHVATALRQPQNAAIAFATSRWRQGTHSPHTRAPAAPSATKLPPPS